MAASVSKPRLRSTRHGAKLWTSTCTSAPYHSHSLLLRWRMLYILVALPHMLVIPTDVLVHHIFRFSSRGCSLFHNLQFLSFFLFFFLNNPPPPDFSPFPLPAAFPI